MNPVVLVALLVAVVAAVVAFVGWLVRNGGWKPYTDGSDQPWHVLIAWAAFGFCRIVCVVALAVAAVAFLVGMLG